MTKKPVVATFVSALCLAALATGALASPAPVSAVEGLGAPVLLAKHGADDPAGDKRRGRGADDGAGHA